MDPLRRAFRLLPGERVIWSGAPTRGVGRDRIWVWAPIVALVFGLVSASFGALVAVTGTSAWESSAMVAAWCVVFAIGAWLVPHYAIDSCRYAVTDRRVLIKTPWAVRSIDRAALSFARITWHRSARDVGHLELVRAVPFGPLSRSQRLVLFDVTAPDAVLAKVRRGGDEVTEPLRAMDRDLPLTDRLDEDERVVWGGGPEGSMVGWRELAIAVLGLVVLALGMRYGWLAFGIAAELEEHGLPVGSLVWSLLVVGTLSTFALLLTIGGGLVWYGTVHARAEGAQSEYLVTDQRVLIRRGLTELSLDRARIVDVAVRPAGRGLVHAFLILDGPEGRALADGGALGTLLPARATVPPVLWELGDPSALRRALFGAGEDSGEEEVLGSGRVSDAA